MVYTLGCIAKIYATCFAKNYSKSWCISKVYAYPWLKYTWLFYGVLLWTTVEFHQSIHISIGSPKIYVYVVLWYMPIIGPDRKGLIKIISTRYFLVIKEIKKISSRYDFDQYFRSGGKNQSWYNLT
jgi:hypothetical protein